MRMQYTHNIDNGKEDFMLTASNEITVLGVTFDHRPIGLWILCKFHFTKHRWTFLSSLLQNFHDIYDDKGFGVGQNLIAITLAYIPIGSALRLP